MKKLPLPHQVEALKEARKHYLEKRFSKGKLIMACGTGKSLTAIWIADMLQANKIAIAIPNLLLESQTVGVWMKEARFSSRKFNYLVVGSDKSIEKVHGVSTTTDEKEIISFIQMNKNTPFIIFTTYYSSPRLLSALGKTMTKLNLCCFDEAHNTAGIEKNANALLNNTDELVDKKLFMTATEKFFSSNLTGGIFSMNEETVFGQRFYHLSTREAIQKNILCDYKILTLYSTKKEIVDWINSNVQLSDKNHFVEERISYVSIAISICKAIQKYDLKKIITYHSSVAGAKRFIELFDVVAALSGVKIDTFHVNHEHNQRQKEGIFQEYSTAKRSLLSNARAITEGYDLPSIDSIVFADERNSVIEIIQAIGRALRKSPGKVFAYIMLPILHDDNEFSHFETVRKTLAAIATTDERVADYFSKKERGRNPNANWIIHEKITKDIDLAEFSEAITYKVWQRTAHLYYWTYEEAKKWMDDENLSQYGVINSESWRDYIKGKFPSAPALPSYIPNRPEYIYKGEGWKDYRHFLNTTPWTYEKAKKWVHDNLPINIGYGEYRKMLRSKELPPQIMSDNYYGDLWEGYTKFLPRKRIPYDEAKEWFQQNLAGVIESQSQYRDYLKGKYPGLPVLPEGMLRNPTKYAEYKDWFDYSGKKKIKYWQFKKARQWVIENLHGLRGHSHWRSYVKGEFSNLPALPSEIYNTPDRSYKEFISWEHWYGINT